MTIPKHWRPAAMPLLTTLAVVGACETQPEQPIVGLQAHSFAKSEWSEPVNIGTTVNSNMADQAPSLSKDGLSLYFASNRPGGLGGNDFWVSQRACGDCAWDPVNLGPPINTTGLEAAPHLSKDGRHLYFTSNRPGGFGLQDLWVARRACAKAECPWDEPVNLGPLLNTGAVENGANLSNDEHLLFFFSGRPGGQGANDIWVSRRADPEDDFGWEEPVSLGADVNTADLDQKPWYQQNAEEGVGNLYFARGDPLASAQDIYHASVTRDGATRGPSVFVAALNIPNFNDAGATLRADAREIVLSSNRPGTLGMGDLLTSTRQTVHDSWDPPVNLGAPLNTAAQEQQPSLSHDGRILIWASTRPGGVGGLDIWMATRTPSGH